MIIAPILYIHLSSASDIFVELIMCYAIFFIEMEDIVGKKSTHQMANSEEPDQTTRYKLSDLDLGCLQMWL